MTKPHWEFERLSQSEKRTKVGIVPSLLWDCVYSNQ